MNRSDEQLRYLQHARTFRALIERTFLPTDAATVWAAHELMVELHVDQARRPDGALYIEHPLAVASQVLDAMAQKDPQVVVAALLHDAVEDQATRLVQRVQGEPPGTAEDQTRLALDAIEEYTQSARVRNIVAGLTNPDFDVLLARTWKGVRPGQSEEYTLARNALYAEHVSQAICDPDVALIKLFDLLANALTLDTIPKSAVRRRLLKKYTSVIGIMHARLQDAASPLNIIPQKRAQVLARLGDALAAGHVQQQRGTS